MKSPLLADPIIPEAGTMGMTRRDKGSARRGGEAGHGWPTEAGKRGGKTRRENEAGRRGGKTRREDEAGRAVPRGGETRREGGPARRGNEALRLGAARW